MCGICGKYFFDKDRFVESSLIKEMMDVMHHRGPDDEGMYISGQVGLGHKRLSIIDLNTGKQPISNEDGKIWVVFNGEIYNYQELRQYLLQKGHFFKTATDTEVLVHLYEEFGEEFISMLRGMFAFAIWDERGKKLLLARDRVGIKPLYYCLTDKFIAFASEIKSLLQDEAVPREIDAQGIDIFLTYYYMPGSGTLFKEIHKLSPGHYLIVRDGRPQIKQYWDLKFATQLRRWTVREAKEELLMLLRDTVRDHMMSDVPVGFLLSGGVDSTALLSFAIDETDKDISTFTIGFEGQDFADERYYARLAAERFGTRHYDMTITAKEFADFLPRYVWFMEEPVCEPPAVALYYVSKLAKDYVKVVISGEGGDEAFAGYQNYRNLVWLERLKWLFGPFKTGIGRVLHAVAKRTDLGRLEKYVPLLSVPLA